MSEEAERISAQASAGAAKRGPTAHVSDDFIMPSLAAAVDLPLSCRKLELNLFCA